MENKDFIVKSLGKGNVESPLVQTLAKTAYDFTTDNDRILYDNSLENFKKFLQFNQTYAILLMIYNCRLKLLCSDMEVMAWA